MSAPATGTQPAAQLAAADWAAIAGGLDASGCAVTPPLLAPGQCGELAALYDQPDRFRATIDMARHRSGSAPSALAAATPSAWSATTPDRAARAARSSGYEPASSSPGLRP